MDRAFTILPSNASLWAGNELIQNLVNNNCVTVEGILVNPSSFNDWGEVQRGLNSTKTTEMSFVSNHERFTSLHFVADSGAASQMTRYESDFKEMTVRNVQKPVSCGNASKMMDKKSGTIQLAHSILNDVLLVPHLKVLLFRINSWIQDSSPQERRKVVFDANGVRIIAN